MTSIHGFEAVARADARRLVLGSMPSVASLRAREYYAHPRNAFWPIIESLFGLAPGLPYQQRCAQLRKNRIALWDVLKTCLRSGSLDSDIVEDSIVPNDFETFFHGHSQIECIYFNGTRAEQMYEKYVRPRLPAELAGLSVKRLPSTSPANAAISFSEKLELWRVVAE